MKHETPVSLFNDIADSLREGGLCSLNVNEVKPHNLTNATKVTNHTCCVFKGKLYVFNWNGFYYRAAYNDLSDYEVFVSPCLNFYRVAASDVCMLALDTANLSVWRTEDGVNWYRSVDLHSQYEGTPETIKFVNNRFFVLFSKGSASNYYRYLKSTDKNGNSWAWGWGPTASGSTRTMSIAYGNSKYIMVFSSPASIWYCSNIDASSPTWSQISLPSGITANSTWLSDIASNGSQFIITTYLNKYIYISGTTAYAYNAPGTQTTWGSVVFSTSYSRYVMNGSYGYAVSTTNGGTAWTYYSNSSSSFPSNYASGSLADGVAGNYVAIFRTYNDVIEAIEPFSSTTTTLRGCVPILYSCSVWGIPLISDSKVIKCIEERTQYLLSTSNFREFTLINIGYSAIWMLGIYGNNKYIFLSSENALGSNNFAYSVDGINWTVATKIFNTRMWDGCYGREKYVVVGEIDSSSSGIYHSTDGLTWYASTVPISTGNLRTVCFANNKFVASGYNINKILYSDDGINWTASSNILDGYSNQNIVRIVYGNDKFVALPIADTTPVILTSVDGTTWSSIDISQTQLGSLIKYNIVSDGQQYIINTDMTIYSTQDLSNFTLIDIYPLRSYRTIYFKNSFIAFTSNAPFFARWYPKFLGHQTIKADDFPEAIGEYGGIEVVEDIETNTPKRTTYPELFSDIADSLRACGASGDIVADDFPDVIDSI